MNSSSCEVLRAANLRKAFADPAGVPQVVLRDISLSISRGRIIALLGASGCGKSTLLRILAGLEHPDHGEIRCALSRPGPQIGFAEQGERLLPWRTIVENVALPLELTGTTNKRARQCALAYLDRVGLSSHATSYPSDLSGGMTQRALLARTLVHSPQLLLLDEPLGQLDVLGRRELSSVLRENVGASSSCAILVTHSVEEAIAVADQILVLGRPPAVVYARLALSPECVSDDFVLIPRERAFELTRDVLLAALEVRE